MPGDGVPLNHRAVDVEKRAGAEKLRAGAANSRLTTVSLPIRYSSDQHVSTYSYAFEQPSCSLDRA